MGASTAVLALLGLHTVTPWGVYLAPAWWTTQPKKISSIHRGLYYLDRRNNGTTGEQVTIEYSIIENQLVDSEGRIGLSENYSDVPRLPDDVPIG